MDDYDVDLNYDTDEISLTSTRYSDNDKDYDIKCILSEAWADDEQGNTVKKYLIEWEGYRKDECKRVLFHQRPHASCTWEPEEGLEKTGLLEPWKRAKVRMGPDAFRKFKDAREAEFYRARARHVKGEPFRKEKRAKKRNQLNKLKRTGPPTDSSDSEEDVPLMTMQKKTAVSLKPRQPAPSVVGSQSSYYNNFVDSQDPNPLPPPPTFQASEEGLFVAERKAPFNQDTTDEGSSSSLNSDSDDSLMGELAEGAVRRRLNGKSKATRVPNLGNSILSPKSPRRKAAVSSEGPAPKKNVATMSRNDDSAPKLTRKLTAPVAAMVPKVTQLKAQSAQSGAPAAQNSSPDSRRKSIGYSTAPENSVTAPAKTATSAPFAGASSRPAGSTAIRRTGGSNKSSAAAIKFTNEPKTQQRKSWQHSEDRQYNKLHFRAVAQKRSQMEGTPDLASLDFVGAAPVGLSKPRAGNDNPYGRREAGSRRVQEPDSYEPRRRDSIEDTVPLENYEANKVPLVCPHWRYGSNCPYGPVKCNFMHRNKDENGKDLPVGDMSGALPPKFRRPPLTCLYWLNNERGCKKPDDVCIYAHKNTGWVPKDMNDNQAVKIDPTALPVSALATKAGVGRIIGPQEKRKMRPSELTCWYWTQNKCKNSAEKCTFQHYDTGVVADAPPSALTCRFWIENRCRQTAEECKFQHWNTGIISGQPSAVLGDASTFLNNGIQQDHSAHSPATDLHTAWTEPQTPPEQLDVPPPPPPVPLAGALKPRAKHSCSKMKDQLEQALQINYTDIFEWTQTSAGRIMIDRRAMLLYHPTDHAEELEVITRWLIMHHVEVSSPWNDGCWDYFRQQISDGQSGIILAHPDFEYYTQLPGFGNLLCKQVRLWSLGVQEGIEYDSALSSPANMQHDCLEIFPVGGLIYLTEDVFENKPQLALQIMRQFFAKIDKLRKLEGPVSLWQEVDDAPLLWRLCVRPELMEYLFTRCEEQSSLLDARDPDALARATLYNLLSENNYIEQDHPVLPLSVNADRYPVMSERRIIAEAQPLNYFATATRDPEEATRRMIRYYAGLHVDMRRDYRHFYVVHSEPFAPRAREWKKDIQTITDVIGPERCLVELKKVAVTGDDMPLFDFHERHMPALTDLSIQDAPVDQGARDQSRQVTSLATLQATDGQISIDGGEMSMSDGEV